MTNHQKKKDKIEDNNISVSRRNFLKVTGTIVLVAGTGCMFADSDKKTSNITQNLEEVIFPPSDSYILVDTKKCQGCVNCMLACSLVHEGVESQSLSGIQIIDNIFTWHPGTTTCFL